MPNPTKDRVKVHMDIAEIITVLSDGNPGAVSVLIKWLETDPLALMGILTLDSKRLYGSRIWVVYKDVCGEDLERFKYHLEVELPNQETGELSVTGPYSPSLSDIQFWEKRTSGKPGADWALDVPPTTSQYEFPIR